MRQECIFFTIILYCHLRVCHAFLRLAGFLSQGELCHSLVSWHVAQPAFWFNEVTWLAVLQEQL